MTFPVECPNCRAQLAVSEPFPTKSFTCPACGSRYTLEKGSMTLVNFPDYYAAIGVDQGATDDQIEKALKPEAWDSHPDVHKNDPDKVDEFRLLMRAAEVLRNVDKRREYDRMYITNVLEFWDAKRPFSGRRVKRSASQTVKTSATVGKFEREDTSFKYVFIGPARYTHSIAICWLITLIATVSAVKLGTQDHSSIAVIVGLIAFLTGILGWWISAMSDVYVLKCRNEGIFLRTGMLDQRKFSMKADDILRIRLLMPLSSKDPEVHRGRRAYSYWAKPYKGIYFICVVFKFEGRWIEPPVVEIEGEEFTIYMGCPDAGAVTAVMKEITGK